MQQCHQLLKSSLQWIYRGILITLLIGCQRDVWITVAGETMGTYYTIKYLKTATTPSVTQIQATIEQKLRHINAQMSTFQEDSEITRFNRSRNVEKPFPLSPEILTVVKEAIRLHPITQGGLDITLGPLVNLWGFGPTPAVHHPPLQETVSRQLQRVGMDKIVLHAQGLSKRLPELSIDLSAIAKGFTVDLLADYLGALGITHYLVDIGGEIRVNGRNPHRQPWRIAIEQPHHGIQQVINPGQQAVATSGDYRNYFEHQGVRYSHTLDPRTGKPITHSMVSVTVLHPSCMTADGLATGLNVLGPEKALAVANQLQLPVLFIVKNGENFEQYASEGWKLYTQVRKDPLLTTIALSFIALCCILCGMAIGYLTRKKCLLGSCGGLIVAGLAKNCACKQK